MQEFHNQYVRDLAWVIRANCCIKNPLIPSDDFFENEYEKLLPTLKKLDEKPDELIEFLKRSKRITLGNYFEDLVHFWLLNRNDCKILARGLQIRNGKITIGECDFVVKMDGVITHIEVATKFYLAIQNSPNQKAWVGRGLTDRLDIKLDKLFTQQLNLSETTPMQNMLKEQNILSIEKKLAIFKGYFFQYYFSNNHAFPNDSNPSNIDAFWCKISELKNLPAGYDEWQMLSKPHWLTHSDGWVDKQEIAKQVRVYFAKKKETPVLCNVKNGDEITKFFIAPERWPVSN